MSDQNRHQDPSTRVTLLSLAVTLGIIAWAIVNAYLAG